MLLIDFHTHTYHSYDSFMQTAKILTLAKERGLNGIVISDHNSIQGGIECSKINKDPLFKVIVASEIKTSVGDITGLNLTDQITAYNYSDVIEQIRNQGGQTLLVHPYYNHKLSEINFNGIDLIEGYNSRVPLEKNLMAVELGKLYNKPIVGGSDAHLYNEIANCKTLYENFNDLMKPIKVVYNRNTFYSEIISQGIKVVKTKSARNFYKWIKWTPGYLYKRIIEK